MALSFFARRVWRGVGSLLAIFAVLTFLPATVNAGTCDCACAGPDQAMVYAGPTCTTATDCSFSICQGFCAQYGAGFRPSQTRGAECRPEESRGAGTPSTGSAPTGPGSGTPAPAPSTGTDTPAPAPSGEIAPTSTSSGGSSGGGLRFVLPSCTNDGNCSLTDIINTGIRFANFLVGLSGIVFLGIFLYAGANIILFANDEGSFKKAKAMIQGAVVGVVIVMVAGVAVRFVSSTLGVNQSLLRTPGASTRSTPTPPPASTPPASR